MVDCLQHLSRMEDGVSYAAFFFKEDQLSELVSFVLLSWSLAADFPESGR